MLPAALGNPQTTQRLKQVCGQVFRYAIATGRAERDPATGLHGALRYHQDPAPCQYHGPGEGGALLRTIDGLQGSLVVACALQLAPLLFVRPGE